MSATWQDVRCARIATADLSALADLRRERGIRVAVDGPIAWVFWNDDSGETGVTRRVLLERLLPLAGVEVFVHREGAWYRPGAHLPSFDVPVIECESWTFLDRAILPGAVPIATASAEPARPVGLRIVRDGRGVARRASALRCRLRDLARWANLAPTVRIESLLGAWCPIDGDPGAVETLVIARNASLPEISDGLRYWGESVLIPIGFRTDPELAESSIREVVGAVADELVILDEAGPESIPREAFRPLRRAGIRTAMAGDPPP